MMEKFLLNLKFNVGLKGTVSVISNDPACKDVNARFTKAPLKPLSYQ